MHGTCPRGHAQIPALWPGGVGYSHIHESDALACSFRESLSENLEALRARGLHEKLTDQFALALMDDDEDEVRHLLGASLAFLSFTDEQIASTNAGLDRP